MTDSELTGAESEPEPPPTELKVALDTLAALINDVTDPVVVSQKGVMAIGHEVDVDRQAWRVAENGMLDLIGRYQIEPPKDPAADLKAVIRTMSAVLGIEPSV